MPIYEREYAAGTGADIIIPIVKAGSADFSVAADWTPVAGDVKISKNGGAAANIATLPVFVTSIGWKFVFSDAELTAARININVVDSATKAIEDQHISIETYGNALAQHAFNRNAANVTVGTIVAAALDAIWDEVMTGATTARQTQRLIQAAHGGKVSGASGTPVLIRDIGDTKNVIDATVDADGNRSAVTLDLS